MTSIRLGPGTEFDRVRAIAAALGPHAAGLGDDAAELPEGPGTRVISTDVSVAEVHFRLEWLSLEEIGWRAAAAALSDLAAMGAAPDALLTAVVVPAEAAESDLVTLMRGVGEAASSVGASVVGGDLSRGSAWVVAVTVTGRAFRPVPRTGARAGDELWVTGHLGGARAAVAAWQAGREPIPALRETFARPSARCAAGVALAEAGATALIDLSDGLAGDAGHLAAASGVRLVLDLDRLPLHPGLVGGVGGEAEARREAAVGGEDYELLAALPSGNAADDLSRLTGVPVTRIGRVAEGTGLQLTLGGRDVVLPGFSHFS